MSLSRDSRLHDWAQYALHGFYLVTSRVAEDRGEGGIYLIKLHSIDRIV